MEKMTLSDGFNRRKKLAADLATWTNRLKQSGADNRWYRTQKVTGKGAFAADPGTDRSTERHYTIEECRKRIAKIVKEDRSLARRISLTNQIATSTIVDLDGKKRELTIPELLVLRNDIIPKLEAVARAIPTRKEGVPTLKETKTYALHRIVNKVERKKTSFRDEVKVEEMELLGYDVVETKDYGLPQRDVWNEVDKIQEFAQRVKQAIARANKVELID